jgi:hypothetical protein
MQTDLITVIAKIFLGFTHEIVILPLIILGYIWLNQKNFYNAICLLLISMLFNYALKVTFKIPLAPTLGKTGFAFPSGHMQSAVVLYGWLITKIKQPIVKILIILLLIGVGLSLVYFGYHNYLDILGAIFFGILLIFIYNILLNNINKYLYYLILSFSSILMLYIAIIHNIAPHLWMAYYGLIGLIITEKFFISHKIIKKNINNKILATILCFVSIFIIKALFCIKFMNGLPVYLQQLQWILIGGCIPWSVYYSSLLK